MKFETIVNSIESLPPLSDVILNIQKMYAKGTEYIKINELIALIETDALLSANILMVSNSPVYGFSNKIASVSQAVTLFGIMRIYAFIINFAIDENIKADTQIYNLSNEKFNDMCRLQTSMIIQWYRKINFKDAQFLSSLALIMESGKLIVASEVTKSSYEDEFRSGFIKCRDIDEYERSLIGMTSYNVSALLFKHWNLEPLYVEILESLDNKDELNQKVALYVEIINAVKIAVNAREFLTKRSVLRACKLLKKMDIELEPFVEVAITIKKSYIQTLKDRQES